MWHFKAFDELTAREFHDIIKVRSQIFVVEQKSPFQEVDGVDLNAVHILKTANNDIQAYVRVYEKEEDTMSFGRVLVPENFRGQGLGRELLEQVMHYLNKKYPDKEVIIQAEEYLTDFYESFGFDIVSDKYLDVGIWHVEMKLKNSP